MQSLIVDLLTWCYVHVDLIDSVGVAVLLVWTCYAWFRAEVR